jgi:hypothetical protein
VLRFGIQNTPRGRKVGATIAALSVAPVLPGPEDLEVPVPPTGRAYVRRVQGENLWLWYRATDEVLRVVTLTDQPPVPVV